MRSRLKRIVLVLCLTGGGVCALPIANHRAVYEISLERALPSAGIRGVHGAMALEVRRQCDETIVNQVFKSEFTGADDRSKSHTLKISSVEAANGAQYRFSLHNEVDGVLSDAFRGEARHAGANGKITYATATFADGRLPADVIFPSQHLARLIAFAEAGERGLGADVFDGSERAKIYHTAAIIGRREDGETGARADLSGLAHWPVTISYYRLGSDNPQPEYQTSFELYANGVSGWVVIDYGGYALRAELRSLTILPVKACAAHR